MEFMISCVRTCISLSHDSYSLQCSSRSNAFRLFSVINMCMRLKAACSDAVPGSDVFGEIEHRFVVLDGIQEKLYPPVRSVEIIDKETDQPRCDKEGHETQYDCPPRNDAGHAQARHQYDGNHLQKNAYV